MSKFHPLRIARVERETRDAVAVTFDVPDVLRERFRFVQGQHLTLRADIGGEIEHVDTGTLARAVIERRAI